MKKLTIYQVNELLYSVTIPKIITKILINKKRILLFCYNKNEMEYIDKLLWTFSQLSFIPHATENDQFNIDLQEVFITTDVNVKLFQDKHLIFLSQKLLSKIKINIRNDIFLITKELNSLNIKNLPSSILPRVIKHFKQNNDRSWTNITLSS